MDPHYLGHVSVGEASEDRFDGTLEVSPGETDAVQGTAPKVKYWMEINGWVKHFVFAPVGITAT